jgi:hypothetical protein
MAPKVQRVRVSKGPVIVDTSFVTTSLEGMGAHYINGRDPRGMVAIALGSMFGACGAAELGESLEVVDQIIEETEETFSYYKHLARTIARRKSNGSSEAISCRETVSTASSPAPKTSQQPRTISEAEL